MNQDSSLSSQSETDTSETADVEAQRAHALEDVRQHVKQSQEKEAAKAQRLNSHPAPPQRFWEFSPDSTTGFLYEIFGERFLMVLGIFALCLVISGIFWLSEVMRWPLYYLVRDFDTATGARLLPWAPWAMWTLWGGIFGGCLGYWLVAPAYGNRELRVPLLLVPILVMVVVGLLVAAFS